MGQGSDDYYNLYEPEREKRNRAKGFFSLVLFIVLIIAFIRVVVYFLYQVQV